MKLSELVNFKNELDKLSVMPAARSADSEVSKITYLIETFQLTAPQITDFNQRKDAITQKFVEFEQQVNNLKESIKLEIERAERAWFQESYRLYDQEMSKETSEYRLNRRMSISPESARFLRARLSGYNNWKYPGMIIHPGLEDFVSHMVMFDPLYIVDQSHDLLSPCMASFTEEYQRRVRPYVIKESVSESILGQIPNEQLGICLAYNFFNFKPLEIFKCYLTEIYSKLRPGGSLLLTFNDCDRDKAVMLVEQHFCCYTPGSLIIKLAENIGYVETFKWHDNGPWTWLELKKPGELTSLRGGQTLAKIMRK